MLSCCTCIFCRTLSKQVADVMVLYPEYFRVPSQERHFPTWDSHNTSPDRTPSISNLLTFQKLVPYISTPLCSCFFSQTHCILQLCLLFLFKNSPFLFSFPFTLTFFFFDTSHSLHLSDCFLVVVSVLFPSLALVFPGNWKPSRGQTRFWLKLFWQDCFTEGVTPMPCCRRKCVLGCRFVPSLECWVWP